MIGLYRVPFIVVVDSVSEWLSRQLAKLLHVVRAGSSPAAITFVLW